MSKEKLREYVKTALQYGWAEVMDYKVECCEGVDKFNGEDDMVWFDIFYAKDEREFLKNIIMKEVIYNLNDIIDEMKEDGHFEEDDDINKDDLIDKIEITKDYLECSFNGEGYYDFWGSDAPQCERIDKIIETIRFEKEDKELEDGDGVIHIIKSEKREVSDDYVDVKLKKIDSTKKYWRKYSLDINVENIDKDFLNNIISNLKEMSGVISIDSITIGDEKFKEINAGKYSVFYNTLYKGLISIEYKLEVNITEINGYNVNKNYLAMNLQQINDEFKNNISDCCNEKSLEIKKNVMRILKNK